MLPWVWEPAGRTVRKVLVFLAETFYFVSLEDFRLPPFLSGGPKPVHYEGYR